MKLPSRIVASAGAGASMFVLLAQQQGKQVPTPQTPIQGRCRMWLSRISKCSKEFLWMSSWGRWASSQPRLASAAAIATLERALRIPKWEADPPRKVVARRMVQMASTAAR